LLRLDQTQREVPHLDFDQTPICKRLLPEQCELKYVIQNTAVKLISILLNLSESANCEQFQNRIFERNYFGGSKTRNSGWES